MTRESIEAMLDDLKRVEKLARIAIGPENMRSCAYGEKIERYMLTGKITGSLRRASLDLTRALAEMRKP